MRDLLAHHYSNCSACELFFILNQTDMKTNMGTADRIIRLFISALFATLYITDVVPGILGIILLVLAGVFTLTSIFSFCPIYYLFGLSTCGVQDKSA